MNEFESTMMQCLKDKAFVEELLQNKTAQDVQAFRDVLPPLSLR